MIHLYTSDIFLKEYPKMRGGVDLAQAAVEEGGLLHRRHGDGRRQTGPW